MAQDWLVDGEVPATTVITSARDRLGPGPVRLLFESTAPLVAMRDRTIGALPSVAAVRGGWHHAAGARHGRERCRVR